MKPKPSIGSQISRHFQRTARKLKGIRVYALIGPAGTGKSFRARLIADRHEIDAIIDDGLLIYQGKILAGKSAKQDQHYLTAIKTALFHEPEHRAAVRKALKLAKFRRILLLGTSDRMIERNCQTLELPTPSQIFRIEDIATEAEIEAARHDRKAHGKHVIPLPVIEVKQAYPKLITRAIQVWLKEHIPGKRPQSPSTSYEKSVVRPAYRDKGEVTISENALIQMILHCLREKSPELAAEKIRIRQDPTGYRIDLKIKLPYGINAADTCLGLHGYMVEKIERYAGIKIERLSIQIQSIGN